MDRGKQAGEKKSRVCVTGDGGGWVGGGSYRGMEEDRCGKLRNGGKVDKRWTGDERIRELLYKLEGQQHYPTVAFVQWLVDLKSQLMKQNQHVSFM